MPVNAMISPVSRQISLNYNVTWQTSSMGRIKAQTVSLRACRIYIWERVNKALRRRAETFEAEARLIYVVYDYKRKGLCPFRDFVQVWWMLTNQSFCQYVVWKVLNF